MKDVNVMVIGQVLVEQENTNENKTVQDLKEKDHDIIRA